MKKDISFWQALVIMARASQTKEGEEQFFSALDIFDRKVGGALFSALAFLSAIFVLSAFVEFRGALDFIFRAVFGFGLGAFAFWALSRKAYRR